jgi:hypothetical protein
MTTEGDEQEPLMLRILREMRAEMRDRFDAVEQRLEAHDTKIDGLQLEVRGGFGPIHRELGAMRQELTSFREDVNELGVRWTLLEARVKKLEPTS